MMTSELTNEIPSQTSSSEVAQQSVFSFVYDRSTKEVLVKDIVMLEGDGNYTFFHLSNGKRILMSKTLRQFENVLETTGFLRVHKSYLVNLKHLIGYDVKEKDEMKLRFRNGTKVEVSRRKQKDVMLVVESVMNSLAS